MGRIFERNDSSLDLNTTFNSNRVRDLVYEIQSLASRDMRILFQNLSVRMDPQSREGIMHILWGTMSEKEQIESPFSLAMRINDGPTHNLGRVDGMFQRFALGSPSSDASTSYSNYADYSVGHTNQQGENNRESSQDRTSTSTTVVRRSREEVEDSIMQILIQVLQRSDRNMMPRLSEE